MNRTLNIPVTIVNLVGETYFAVCQLGGVTIRGHKASTPLKALQNLLFKLQNGDDDAELALELALAGTTLDGQLAVTSGEQQG